MYLGVIRNVILTNREKELTVDTGDDTVYVIKPEHRVKIAEDTLVILDEETNKAAWIDCKAIKTIIAKPIKHTEEDSFY